MDLKLLLQWHYLIFLLPFAVAALMLLISALQGTDGDGDGDGDADTDGDGDLDGEADGGDAESDAEPGDSHDAHSGRTFSHLPPTGGDQRTERKRKRAAEVWMPFRLIGVGRAPTTIVLETLTLGWGFCGFWANQILLKTPTPTLAQMLPSFGIALVGGVLTARLTAELFARVIPSEETFVVSRERLFGQKGRVMFPVTETTGRLRIYDEHGTIHEHACRLAPGHPAIERGKTVLVMDIDAQGRLIVEEIAG